MKDYLNLFYSMLDKIDPWEKASIEERRSIMSLFVNSSADNNFLAEYFEKYRIILLNNTLNSYIKGVVKH